MSPLRATRTCLGKCLTFSGRASRPEFWGFLLVLLLVGAAAFALDRWVLPQTLMDRASGTSPGRYGDYRLVTVWLIVAPLLLFAAAWRRLHDTSRPGWVLLTVPPAFLAAAWCVLVSAASAMATAPRTAAALTAERALPWAVGLFLATFAINCILLAGRSTPGPNRYGRNPNEAPR